MNIIIEGKKETYRITADLRQYIISIKKIAQKKTKTLEKGEVYFERFGNYSTLEGLFNKLLGMMLRESDATTLAELKKAHTDLKTWLKEEFKGEK